MKHGRKQLFEQAPTRGRAIQESSREGSALRNNAVDISFRFGRVRRLPLRDGVRQLHGVRRTVTGLVRHTIWQQGYNLYVVLLETFP